MLLIVVLHCPEDGGNMYKSPPTLALQGVSRPSNKKLKVSILISVRVSLKVQCDGVKPKQ